MDSYGGKLRAYLSKRGISTRELAKRLNPDKPESARRDLTRLFAGREPREAKRIEIANALGVERSEIEGEEDEEEDLMRALLSQVEDIVHKLDMLRAREIARKHEKRKVS